VEKPRIDKTLEDGSVYTRKTMPNGEERTRMRFAVGPATVITRSSDWKPKDGTELPWQEAHYHAGLTEVYTLISGWAQFIWLNPNVGVSRLDTPGTTLTFQRGVPHLVLLGPGAEISTLLFGLSVPNHERGNNDWWPVAENFFTKIEGEKAVAEKVARATFK
jgi:hypothetical protein